MTGAETFEQANNRLIAGLQSWSPVAAFIAMSGMNASGTCPVFDIDTTVSWFGVLSMDAHCSVMPTIQPVLSTVMFLVYGIIAIKIFMEA